jgi:putative transposase
LCSLTTPRQTVSYIASVAAHRHQLAAASAHPATSMLAVDFFHVDCAATLRRLNVLFALDVGHRPPARPGRDRYPDGHWRTQQARNLVMDLGDHTRLRVLVRDRAGQFTASFDAIMAAAGIAVVKIPPRRPQANCFAERLVLTIRTELTDRILIVGERHLGKVLAVYARITVRGDCTALCGSPPRPALPVPEPPRPRIRRRSLLGGLIHEYETAA